MQASPRSSLVPAAACACDRLATCTSCSCSLATVQQVSRSNKPPPLLTSFKYLRSPSSPVSCATDDRRSPNSAAAALAFGSSSASLSLLKRKRPPKLSIPLNVVALPAAAAAAAVDEQELTFEGSQYGIACKKGRREVMEDTYTAVTNLEGISSQAFYGVFDGHGGRNAADFAAQNLLPNILDARQNGCLEQAVKLGYHSTDAEFLQKGVSSGASCVTALIMKRHLVVANAGDCRAVLVKDGTAVPLTRDHRANREDERQRIEKLGGFVDCFSGSWRVQGRLAVSRGIGDLHYKEYISAEPDVCNIELTGDCEFLILASDGLWDMVSNQEAVDCALNVLRATPQSRQLQASKGASNLIQSSTPRGSIPCCFGPAAACRKLVELSFERGCLDDVTVMIVELKHFINAL